MKDQQTTRPKARRVIMGTLLLLPVIALAENWTEFRGPGGQGHSREQGLPLTWSESKNVAWKVPIPGRGWSSPVLVDDQLWLTTALDDGRSLRAICLNRDTGRIVHNVEVFQARRSRPGPPEKQPRLAHAHSRRRPRLFALWFARHGLHHAFRPDRLEDPGA